MSKGNENLVVEIIKCHTFNSFPEQQPKIVKTYYGRKLIFTGSSHTSKLFLLFLKSLLFQQHTKSVIFRPSTHFFYQIIDLEGDFQSQLI